jgi:hypothetical protein
MAELLLNYGLEMTWKGGHGLPSRKLSAGTQENHNVTQDSQYPGEDSKRTTAE